LSFPEKEVLRECGRVEQRKKKLKRVGRMGGEEREKKGVALLQSSAVVAFVPPILTCGSVF
jgi:hypothetical protein